MALISLEKKFIVVSNNKMGATSIEDQFGQFADFHGWYRVNRLPSLQLSLPPLKRTRHLPPSEAFEPEAEARIRPLWAVDVATLGYD